MIMTFKPCLQTRAWHLGTVNGRGVRHNRTSCSPVLKPQVLLALSFAGLLPLVSIAFNYSAFAQRFDPAFPVQSFDALKGNKGGPECKVTFTPKRLSICGEASISHEAQADYRYRDREHAGRFTAHYFIIGWREQGVSGWKHITIVFRNTAAAERFNAAFAVWADRLPQVLDPPL